MRRLSGASTIAWILTSPSSCAIHFYCNSNVRAGRKRISLRFVALPLEFLPSSRIRILPIRSNPAAAAGTAQSTMHRAPPIGYNSGYEAAILTGDAAGLRDRVGGGDSGEHRHSNQRKSKVSFVSGWK